MTKRKNVVSKMLLLVVILTLISCCFLGSTFARYVSNGSGKASMSVAKWSISDGINEAGVEFGDLSPSMDEYTSKARTNTSDRVLIATIKNDGDVDALVTLSAEEGDPFLSGDGELTYGNGIGDPDDPNPSQMQAEEVFSIALYYSANNTPGTATLYNGNEIEVAVGATIFVFADVTWTSDISGSLTGAAADARDTWLGENVTTVNYVVSYTAVQNSELPDANA